MRLCENRRKLERNLKARILKNIITGSEVGQQTAQGKRSKEVRTEKQIFKILEGD